MLFVLCRAGRYATIQGSPRRPVAARQMGSRRNLSASGWFEALISTSATMPELMFSRSAGAVVLLEVLRREEPRVGEAVDDLEQLAVRRRRDESPASPASATSRARRRATSSSGAVSDLRAQLRAERDQHELLQRRRVLDRAEVGRVREEPVRRVHVGDGDNILRFFVASSPARRAASARSARRLVARAQRHSAFRTSPE